LEKAKRLGKKKKGEPAMTRKKENRNTIRRENLHEKIKPEKGHRDEIRVEGNLHSSLGLRGKGHKKMKTAQLQTKTGRK